MRTALVVLRAVGVAAAGGIAATGALGGHDGAAAAVPSPPTNTVKVKRATLTSGQTVDGTLGYGDVTPVQTQAASGAPAAPAGSGGGREGATGNGNASGAGGTAGSSGTGIVTWLPRAGDVIRRGEPVYSLGEQRVPLLYGSLPLYRTLKEGSTGKDVEMLEQNLAALGYTGITVDDRFTASTARAVKAWQSDLGRVRTGTVGPGDAVVAASARRVDEVKAVIGGSPGESVLTWTGTQRIVTVDLETQYEALVKVGTKATVKLPGGTTVDAAVTDVGTAATAAPAAGGGSSGSGGSAKVATLPIRLTVRDQQALGPFQAAPVDVTFTAYTRQDVLAVPVEALVARTGGGYAVQAVEAGRIRVLPVTLGMFGNGMVEISGDRVTEGLAVVVPQ